MPTREVLHKLVDSLPDGARGSSAPVSVSASSLASAPRASNDKDAQEMEDRRREWRQRQKPGTGSIISGSGGYNPTDGSGSYSMKHWDEDTFVTETLRIHKGHELTVIERIRIEGQHLVYKHEVTGPGEKRDEREVVFDLPG